MITLRSKITQGLLNYFFTHPGTELYLNQMSRLLDLDRGNLVKKLMELEANGLLVSEFRGNQHYFRLNSNYPLLKELKSIVSKTIGLEALIKNAFSGMPGIKKVILFGSFANETAEAESDIDIMVIGNCSHLDIAKVAIKLQNHLKKEINIIDFSEREFQSRTKKHDPFVKEVMQQPHVNIV